MAKTIAIAASVSFLAALLVSHAASIGNTVIGTDVGPVPAAYAQVVEAR